MTTVALPAPARGEWAAEARATLALSWPLILTNVTMTGMTTTDVVILGWLGPDALAASALGTNLYFMFAILGMGLLSAPAPMIASELGRNRFAVREVRRTVRQGLWAALLLVLPIWLVLWNGERVLRLIGQEPALAEAAGAYVRALQWALLPFFVSIVLRGFLSALERPGYALAAGIGGVLVNALAVWALTFGKLGLPALGITGAGLGSTFAMTFVVVALLVAIGLDRRLKRYRLMGRLWRADWPRFRSLWRLGLPIAATLWFEVSIFNVAVFLMGLIGAASLAAHAIAIQIASLTFMVPLGIAQAATVRVGRAFGARDPEGVRRAGWVAFALGVGAMTLTAALMVLAPRMLAGAFLDRADPANGPVIEIAVTFLMIAAAFQIADGAQVVGAGMLRGLHDTRIPMLLALAGYWGVGLPLGAALAFLAGWNGVGLWVGLATGLAVVAVLMLRRWLARERLALVPSV